MWDLLGTMLVLKHEHDLIAQHPAEPTPQIVMPQLSQLAQHRAIALGQSQQRLLRLLPT
jgi:hypothetical protein